MQGISSKMRKDVYTLIQNKQLKEHTNTAKTRKCRIQDQEKKKRTWTKMTARKGQGRR